VAQVVEAVRHVELRCFERQAVAAQDRRLIHRPARQRVGEHEIVVAGRRGRLEQPVQLARDNIGHRHRPRRTPRLRRAELPEHVVLTHPHARRWPVNVS
jgi:hypothetical protein